MSHVKATIDDLVKDITEKEAALAQDKELVNRLCQRIGLPPVYTVTTPDSAGLGSIRADTFYGQPLNSCIRQVLELRKGSGAGPASVREIYETLKQGGFQFDSASEENAMRNLRISLTKSSHTFHKLPNNQYGLRSWYPALKEPKAKSSDAATANGEEKGDGGGNGDVEPAEANKATGADEQEFEL